MHKRKVNNMGKIRQTKLWFLGIALAAIVQCTSQAGLSYLNIGYYGDYGVTVVAQGNPHSTYATAFSADWQNIAGSQPLPANHSDPFVTFCMDINTILGSGWWQSGSFSDANLTQQSPPATRFASGLYSAANLYAHYAGGILNANGSWADRAEGAALQLAIWEVLYEPAANGYDVLSTFETSGFKATSVDSGIATRANTMLSTWGAADPNIDTTFWNAVNANGTFRSSQDLIGPLAPVPEPTTVLAGLLLLLPFGVSTVRILRKNRA
jgi:hypothetical protein